ncbi:MAG TPA: DUF6531 domain-containing protein [Chloroflexota bacterium]|nr:DUF6531 domain-containing protein [Chloroflexota bacterium]
MKSSLRLGLAATFVVLFVLGPAHGLPTQARGLAAEQIAGSALTNENRHVITRFVSPVAGALTPQELPGSFNPSEPYAAASGTVPTDFQPGAVLRAGGSAHGDVLVGSSSSNGSASGANGPVNPLTGLLSLSFTDYVGLERGLPLDLTRTYNSLFSSVDGPFGHGWSFTDGMRLTASGHNVVVDQENGSEVVFKLTHGQYSAAPRVIAHLLRKPNGKYEFLRGSTTATCPSYARVTCATYEFSATGRLLNVLYLTSESSSGRAAAGVSGFSLHYLGARLVTVRDPEGRKFQFHYGGSGNHGHGYITEVINPDGNAEHFSYSQGNLVTMTDATGAVTHFGYDSEHRLTSATDARGAVTSFTYNGSGYSSKTFHGYIIVETDGDGSVTKLAYSPGSTLVTDPSGNAYTVQYRESELVRVDQGNTTPAIASWQYSYDPRTLGPTSITDPNGGVTSASYDDQGNLVSFTDPLGLTTNYSFDNAGQTTSVTDPMGVKTTTRYDADGNVISESTPLVGTGLSRTTTFAYGDLSHPTDMTAMTDPNGAVWRYAYDKFGNLVKNTDPLGGFTTFRPDSAGRIISETTADGNVQGANPKPYTTTFNFTKDYNVLSVTDGLGSTTSYKYDATGNLVSETDPLGNKTTYSYDAVGQVIALTNPDGSTYKTSYNPDGTIADQVDPAGGKTSYDYDQLGRMTSTADPLGASTLYSYDPAGNLLSTTDANGSITSNAYDADDRLVSVTHGQFDPQTHGIAYVYDADGRVISMTDGTGTTTTTYDSLGRVVSSTGGAGNTVGHGYDANGNATTIDYPGGRQVTQAFDAANRITSVEDWLGNTTSFVYDAGSNLIKEAFPAGNVDAFGYDGNGSLTGIQDSFGGKTLAAFTYTRNTNGQITDAAQTGTGQTDQKYTYDQNGRLLSENGSPYAYDSRDNPTSLPSGAILTYNAADELVFRGTSSGTETFVYDASGDRTGATSSDGTSLSYAYDQAGNMISFSGGSSPATYSYSGDGLRMSKTVGGVTHTFAWDSAADSPRLLQDGSNSYVYGPDGLPLEQVDGSNNVVYYHHDQLGSTRLLTDGTGSVVGTSNFDAYGNPAGQSGVQTPFGFAGQYTDGESGLVYRDSQYYDPSTGQYIRRKLPGRMKSGQITFTPKPAVGLIIIAGVSVGYTYAKRAAIMDNQRKDVLAVKSYVEQAVASQQALVLPPNLLTQGVSVGYTYAKRPALLDNQRKDVAAIKTFVEQAVASGQANAATPSFTPDLPGGYELAARLPSLAVDPYTGSSRNVLDLSNAPQGMAVADPYTYAGNDPVNVQASPYHPHGAVVTILGR